MAGPTVRAMAGSFNSRSDLRLPVIYARVHMIYRTLPFPVPGPRGAGPERSAARLPINPVNTLDQRSYLFGAETQWLPRCESW